MKTKRKRRKRSDASEFSMPYVEPSCSTSSQKRRKKKRKKHDHLDLAIDAHCERKERPRFLQLRSLLVAEVGIGSLQQPRAQPTEVCDYMDEHAGGGN